MGYTGLTKDDGSQVDVNLDKNVNVLSTRAGNESHDAPNDNGGRSQRWFLDLLEKARAAAMAGWSGAGLRPVRKAKLERRALSGFARRP